jgi:hypothetical protein
VRLLRVLSLMLTRRSLRPVPFLGWWPAGIVRGG